MLRVGIVALRFDRRGGSERRTYELVRGLTGKGHEVEVFAGSIMDAEHLDVETHKLGMPGGLSVMKVAGFTANARKALAERPDIDIIHNQIRPFVRGIVSVGGGCHASYLERRAAESGALRRLGFRLNPFHRYVLDLEKVMYSPGGCPAVITNSEMSRRGILEHYGYPADRVFVAYNGVDSERFSPADEAARSNLRAGIGIAEDEIAVVFVGSDFMRKGLGVLMKAMSGLKGYRLVVAGKGDERRYRECAVKYGLKDVIFTGQVRDTSKYYRASDLYALPTLYDPFANTTLEAMASGLPVVTTRDNGVSEIISDWEDGMLMAGTTDYESLRAILLRLSDPAIRRKVGDAARKRVSGLTWEKTLGKTLEVYDFVLSGRKADA